MSTPTEGEQRPLPDGAGQPNLLSAYNQFEQAILQNTVDIPAMLQGVKTLHQAGATGGEAIRALFRDLRSNPAIQLGTIDAINERLDAQDIETTGELLEAARLMWLTPEDPNNLADEYPHVREFLDRVSEEIEQLQNAQPLPSTGKADGNEPPAEPAEAAVITEPDTLDADTTFLPDTPSAAQISQILRDLRYTPGPTETVSPESAEEAKKEIFEKAGKRSYEEALQLLDTTHGILRYERASGKGRMTPTIPSETEYFHDQGIAFIPIEEGKLTIVGDIHGDSETVEQILNKTGFIENMVEGDRSQTIVFMGDYIDRGPQDIRVMEILLDLKNHFPNNVVLIKADHEAGRYVNFSHHDFPQKVDKQYGFRLGDTILSGYENVFDNMPRLVVCGNGVVITHGGIPTDYNEVNLQDIRANETIFDQMIWADPLPPDALPNGITGNFDRAGRDALSKGIIWYSEPAARRFLDRIGGTVIIRGHQTSGDMTDQRPNPFSRNILWTIHSTGFGSTETAYGRQDDGSIREPNPTYAQFEKNVVPHEINPDANIIPVWGAEEPEKAADQKAQGGLVDLDAAVSAITPAGEPAQELTAPTDVPDIVHIGEVNVPIGDLSSFIGVYFTQDRRVQLASQVGQYLLNPNFRIPGLEVPQEQLLDALMTIAENWRAVQNRPTSDSKRVAKALQKHFFPKAPEQAVATVATLANILVDIVNAYKQDQTDRNSFNLWLERLETWTERLKKHQSLSGTSREILPLLYSIQICQNISPIAQAPVQKAFRWPLFGRR